jgi:S1-C subfamily serine protease
MGPPPETVEVIGIAGTHRATTTGGGPRLPVLIARPEPLANSPIVRGTARDLEPGSWVIAIWRGTSRSTFAAGHLVGVRDHAEDPVGWHEAASTIALTPEMLGGGLFDLDGRLLGIIVWIDGRLAVLATDSVDTFIARAAALDDRLLARFGMWIAPLSAYERAELQLDAGLLVREVWDGYAADRQGLAPGDVIVALSDQPVDDLADLQALATAPAAELPPLTIQWRKTRRDASLASAPAASSATAAGVSWESPTRGYRVASVSPASRAEAAGLRSGDAILRIDRVAPRTVNDIDRLLSREAGPRRFLEVRRERYRFGTLF